MIPISLYLFQNDQAPVSTNYPWGSHYVSTGRCWLHHQYSPFFSCTPLFLVTLGNSHWNYKKLVIEIKKTTLLKTCKKEQSASFITLHTEYTGGYRAAQPPQNVHLALFCTNGRVMSDSWHQGYVIKATIQKVTDFLPGPMSVNCALSHQGVMLMGFQPTTSTWVPPEGHRDDRKPWWEKQLGSLAPTATSYTASMANASVCSEIAKFARKTHWALINPSPKFLGLPINYHICFITLSACVYCNF